MNEKTTIRFVLTGVKYSQSDLGKHYKTFCGLYLEFFFYESLQNIELTENFLSFMIFYKFRLNKM